MIEVTSVPSSAQLPMPLRWAKQTTPHQDIVLIASVTSVFFFISAVLLEVISRHVAPFDTSHLLIHEVPSSGLRWDAVHYLGVAARGYTFDQHSAFQPGWHGLLHLLGRKGGIIGMLEGMRAINLASRVIANIYLYKLTTRQFSRTMALTTCLLYAASPAPATNQAPYTESTYAALSFMGTYHAVVNNYLRSAVLFALAGSLRATGVFSVIILLWPFLRPCLQDLKSRNMTGLAGRLGLAGLLAAVALLPFVAFQFYLFDAQCSRSSAPPWCNQRLPMAYGWVQDKYWNIGPFRYWTIAQLPNFIMAGPVLGFSLAGVWQLLSKHIARPKAILDPEGGILIHSALMLTLLVVTSHTQIALRLAVTDPVLWWAVAQQVCGSGSRRMGHAWIWWVLIWSAVSCVLWAAHLPPA